MTAESDPASNGVDPSRASGACVLAVGAISAFGRGQSAYSVGGVGELARTAIRPDEQLLASGLLHPMTARVRSVDDVRGDRAHALLAVALCDCREALDRCLPHWRRLRVGVAIGTSSGGMPSMELVMSAITDRRPIDRDLALAGTYGGPLVRSLSQLGSACAPKVQVLGACASSVLAIGIALRWLELGRCEIVLAGGYDAITTFVAAGFEALRATTASVPRPFRVGRDGLALGEGAAVLALGGSNAMRAVERGGGRGLGWICGFGASADAVHITAPDRTGSGMARSALDALSDAATEPKAVDFTSAHATATPFNDAAEARALATVFGEQKNTRVHAFKAQIGHTLGAAGALETLAALDALDRGVLPASCGTGELDPICGNVDMVERTQRQPVRAVLKLAAAFGGTNGALVLSATPSARRLRPPRDVWLCGTAILDAPLDASQLRELGLVYSSLGRCDRLTKTALSALALLRHRVGRLPLESCGIIVGQTLANFETNCLHAARIRDRGPRSAEPRLFPYTSPNAVAGECAIAFQIRGPAFAVGGGLDGWVEALQVARDFIAAGDVDRMIVISVDEIGAASERVITEANWPRLVSGACAVLLSAEPIGPACRPLGSTPTCLADDFALQAGHRGLEMFCRP